MSLNAYRFWSPDVRTLESSRLEMLKLEKLKRQIAYCDRASPFYRDVFRKHGITADGIKSFAQWREYPLFLDKKTIRDLQQDSLDREGHAFGTHLCAPLEDVVNVYSTSGTTGMPTFYCFTIGDLMIHGEMLKRVFHRMRLKRGDSVLWGFGLGGFVATAVLPVMTELGVRVIPVGAEAGTERLVQFAKLTRPDTLVGSPSFLLHLIESVPALTGKPVSSLGFRRLITGSEPGAGLPDVRRRIFEAYDAPLYDYYGPANQFAFVSDGDEEYSGMISVGSDFGLWEDLVDPVTGDSVPFEDGAVGSMILTEIDREAAPYLRYAMNDVLEVRFREGSDGRTEHWIKVIGRSDDMLIVKGVNVFPAAIQNVVSSFAPQVTGAMRADLDREPPLVTPPLRLRIEYAPEVSREKADEIAAAIESRVRTLLHVRPKITMVPPGSLGRSVRKTALIYREDLHGAEQAQDR